MGRRKCSKRPNSGKWTKLVLEYLFAIKGDYAELSAVMSLVGIVPILGEEFLISINHFLVADVIDCWENRGESCRLRLYRLNRWQADCRVRLTNLWGS